MGMTHIDSIRLPQRKGPLDTAVDDTIRKAASNGGLRYVSTRVQAREAYSIS
jgi:hypothetical protein